MDTSLYQYYQRRGILPTYARFQSAEDVERYERQRRDLFESKLFLPPALFKSAHILEFGPDTGENALVFARWGADLTLVEPNPQAWEHIKAYFDVFGQQDRLKGLEAADVTGFRSDRQFDLVNAEGFIYTVQPTRLWIDQFHSLTAPNGYCAISYYEQYGGLFELFLKAVHAHARALLTEDSATVAWRLFQSKWEAIPHTRAFTSWVMDVLDNPFVRKSWFLEAVALCQEMLAAGFELHASWPRYSDELAIYWHKKPVGAAERMELNRVHLERSRLSFAFGRKLYLCTDDRALIETVNQAISNLVDIIDGLIDRFDEAAATEAGRLFGYLATVIGSRDVFADSPQHRQEIIALSKSCQHILGLMAAGDLQALTVRCNSDPSFIRFWGAPVHYAVFKRMPA